MAQNGTDQKKDNLSAKQKKIVYLMLDFEDRRPMKDKLEEVGVPRRTFYNWMDSEKFKKYLESETRKCTDASNADAWKSLIRNIARGDTAAIKLYFELKGKYSQTFVVERLEDVLCDTPQNT